MDYRGTIDSALRPPAYHWAPANSPPSQSSSQVNTSSHLGHYTQPRFTLDFRSHQGRNSVRQWYERQSYSTRFTLFEYRKHKEGHSRHEFIVVWLNKTTLCRFDRWPGDGERGYTLCGEGVTAVDSAHIISYPGTEYYELLEKTEPLLSIKLPQGEDLGIILAACEGIQIHANTSAYNLLRCSCHFFSWAIVVSVVRLNCNWESGVLSREGWYTILRTSLASVSQISEQYTVETPPGLACRADARWTFAETFARIYHSPDDIDSFRNYFEVEAFKDILQWSHFELYGTIGRILPKILFHSQLNTVLHQTLHHIEAPIFLLAKRTAAENVVLSKCDQFQTFEFEYEHIHRDGFKLESLRYASRATADALSRRENERLEHDNNSWKSVWRSAWDSRKPDAHTRTSRLGALHSPVVLYAHRPELWDGSYIGQRGMENAIMYIWKSAWHDFNGLGAQYAANIMPTIMTTIGKYCMDIAPEQLVFGRNPKKRSSYRLEHIPSFQQFIRDRMREDFEIPNRSGFSSFQYLVETAEEAMCKIWVTSSRIMRSNRYQPFFVSLH